MYLYVELWTARPEWLALSEGERRAFIDSVGGSIGSLVAMGAEPIGTALDDADTPLATGHRFLCAWRMPSKAVAEKLEEEVEKSGWHRYFDQVNARGPILDMDATLEAMVRGG